MMSTMRSIYLLRTLMERYKKRKRDLHMAFKGFRKKERSV